MIDFFRRRVALGLAALPFMSACTQKTEAATPAPGGADPAARKQRSEAVLRAEGVPINAYLPMIESEAEAKQRSIEDVAMRTLALLAVSGRGAGLEAEAVASVITDFGLKPHFTPEEKAFLAKASPSVAERVPFSWRVEAAWALLWALGYVEGLGKPVESCDVGRAVSFTARRSATTFIQGAKLRPISEILDQADLIYRYHWAVVDARLNGAPPPAGLDPDVTLERHHALNWLIGYMDQEWDDITTDT